MSQSTYHLYHYWRSSSSWRVRLALVWKNLKFDTTHIGLLNGESESPEHLNRNPAGFVPVLELKSGTHSGTFLTESLAIIRYLEEIHPEAPTLFPGSALDHARIWTLAELINSGTQPIQNLPLLEYFSSDLDEQKKWAKHWIYHGLEVFEKTASLHPGKFAYGDHFSLADVCLIPQVYNAERFGVGLDAFPRIRKAIATSKDLPAVNDSHPDRYKPAE
jgi:maleylacetoacetate isomerase